MMTVTPSPIRRAEDLRGRHAVVLGLARSGVAASRFLADAGAVVAAYDRRPARRAGRCDRRARGSSGPAGAGRRRRCSDRVCSRRRPARHEPVGLATLPDDRSVAARGAHRGRGARRRDRERGRPVPAADARADPRRSPARRARRRPPRSSPRCSRRQGCPPCWAGTSARRSSSVSLDARPRRRGRCSSCRELQLPTISRGADVALYTNIGEDHLDRHGTVEAYRAVKARLAELTDADGRVVLNHDDAGCRALGGPPAPRRAWRGTAWSGRAAARSRPGSSDGWIVRGGGARSCHRRGAAARTAHARERARRRARGHARRAPP